MAIHVGGRRQVKKFEIQQLRAKTLKEARAYPEQAEAENRDMSGEEKASFDKAMEFIASLDERVKALEQVEAAEASAPVEETNSRKPVQQAETRSGSGFTDPDDYYASKEYRNAWLRAVIQGDHRAAAHELRTVNTTAGTGGYAITPTQLISDVVSLMDNICWIDGFATKYKTSSMTARIPLLSTRMALASYGATEVTSVSADTTQAFTARDLVPRILASLVKVSILSNDLHNMEDLVKREMATAFAYARESKMLTGTGTNEPLGIFVASSSGISTGRDVDSGSTTSITADAVLDCVYKIKQQYLKSKACGWVFHRDAMKIIAKLKDSQNRYLYANGLNGQANTLADFPLYISEYAPNTFTAAKYVGILGDLSQIASVDVTPGLDIQRLDQPYAVTHEVGLLGRQFHDAAPILEEGFARLITSAS